MCTYIIRLEISIFLMYKSQNVMKTGNIALPWYAYNIDAKR